MTMASICVRLNLVGYEGNGKPGQNNVHLQNFTGHVQSYTYKPECVRDTWMLRRACVNSKLGARAQKIKLARPESLNKMAYLRVKNLIL